MTFLESPELGDPKESWADWLAHLRTLNQRDVTVKFEINRAQRVIRQMESFESEQQVFA